MAAGFFEKLVAPSGAALTAAGRRRLASVVGGEGTVVFPTDTFYGLGADPFSRVALAKVYRLKGRPPGRPLLLLLDGPGRVGRFAAALSATHRRLMERFWPGPLTMLFPARRELRPETVSAAGQVALRVPGSPLCRDILAAAGGALTGTSANPSGGAPSRAVTEIGPSLLGGADLVVDAGTLPPAIVSTLLDVKGGRIAALREGAVTVREIEEFLAGERG